MNDQVDGLHNESGGSHADHVEPLAPVEARVAALESVLVEHGLFDTEALDAIVANFEHNLGPLNGAKVVARAWVDPAYKSRLLTDGTAAIAELGFSGPEGDHMVVVENTPDVHNLVVCTLCRVTRGRFSVYRLPGTSSLHIGRVPCVNPGCCSRRWARRSPTTSRSACGTRARRSVTSSCPNGLRERRTSRRGTRDARHSRLDDRGPTPMSGRLPHEVEMMEGPGVLPRDNGELRFAAPWEGRALALGSRAGRATRPAVGRISATSHRRRRRGTGSPLLRELGRCARITRDRPRDHHASSARHRDTDRPCTTLTQHTTRHASTTASIVSLPRSPSAS